MGVGHHTTDEVGLSLVEGGHQVIELALEVGGDSLATLALLPVLVLGSLQGLERESGVSTIDSSFNLYLGCYCASLGKLSKEFLSRLPGQDDQQSTESPNHCHHS